MKINYREHTWNYLPEFIDALTRQLKKDEETWRDTWKKRPREGQEGRMKQSLMDYMDKFENTNTPYPTLKAVGGFFINWIREFEELKNFEDTTPETSVNYLSVVEPYFYIHVGIKNDKVVKVDWSEMLCKTDKFTCNEDIKTTVVEYLNKAKQYLECKTVGDTDEKF